MLGKLIYSAVKRSMPELSTGVAKFPRVNFIKAEDSAEYFAKIAK